MSRDDRLILFDVHRVLRGFMAADHSTFLYVLGPPVCSEAHLSDLIAEFLRCFSGRRVEQVAIVEMRGPVTYNVRFEAAEGTAVRANHGMHGLDLFALQVEWHGRSLCAESFSVVVKDFDFFSVPSNRRAVDAVPWFATFAIISPQDGHVAPGYVFEWLTKAWPSWRNRDVWHSSMLAPAVAEMHRNDTRRKLADTVWSQLYDLHALFPKVPGASRRQGRQRTFPSEDVIQVVGDSVRLDTILPHGLDTFLVGCASRPPTLESLCRDLWLFHHHSCNHRRPPTWLTAGRPLIRVSTPCHLGQWWWAATVHYAGQRLQQLVTAHQLSPDGIETCGLVPGVSTSMRKSLGLVTDKFYDHDAIYVACLRMEKQPYTVELGYGGLTFFQGLRVEDVYFRTPDGIDGSGDAYSDDKASRICLLRWKINGVPVHHSVSQYTIHMLQKVDTTKGYLFFSSPVLVTHAPGAFVTVDVWYGDWSSLTAREYSKLVDPDKAADTAAGLPAFCWSSNLHEHLILPEVFTSDAENCGGLYLCLGGPGVGKSVTKLAPAIRTCALESTPCLLTSNLKKVRNTHLQMLRYVMGESLFESSVVCIGNRDLDPLAKSRTVETLTWNAMEPDVLSHEARLPALQASIYRVRAVISLGARFGFSDITNLIDAYGGFSRALLQQHRRFALERVHLETLVKVKTEQVIERHPIRVGTCAALSGPTAMKQMKVLPGSRHFGLIATDELTKMFFHDYTLWLTNLLPWIGQDTRFAGIGDPCQTVISRSSLDSMTQYTANYGTDASPVDRFLSNIQRAAIAPQEVVSKIDLVNRYKKGARCRDKTAQLITLLAPHCLPAPATFWTQPVHGQPVWSPLQPRGSGQLFEAYLDDCLEEVIRFDTLSGWASASAGFHLVGDIHHSRYNLVMAFASAAIAVSLALRTRKILRDYDIEQWAAHFDSRDAAMIRLQAGLDIHCLTPYRIMVPLISLAIKIIKDKCNATLRGLTDGDILCSTVDSAQGSTFQTTVLSLPDDLAEWSSFLTELKRIITMLSRSYRTVALPRLVGSSKFLKDFPRDAQTHLKMFSEQGTPYRWQQMRESFGWFFIGLMFALLHGSVSSLLHSYK